MVFAVGLLELQLFRKIQLYIQMICDKISVLYS